MKKEDMYRRGFCAKGCDIMETTYIDSGSTTEVAVPHPHPGAKMASKVPGMIATVTCGAFFGAALAASGARSPISVMDQFQRSTYHLMIVYLTAAASSASFIYLAKLLGTSNSKARSASSLDWFSIYDANILGGILQGIGIVMTGSLLETIPVQIALGTRSIWSVSMGALLGGILYSGYFARFRRTLENYPTSLTVYERYGLKEGLTVAVFVVFCLAVIGTANWLQPYEHAPPEVKVYGRFLIEATTEDFWRKPYGKISFASPVVGGLCIGAAQLACLLLKGSAIGISVAYERLGQAWWWIWKYEKRPDFTPIIFCAGILAGAWTLSKLVDIPTLQDPTYRPSIRDVLGGAYLVIGSRLAGGCTSSHGINGLATLSVSSFITMASIIVAVTLWVPVLESTDKWGRGMFVT